MSRHIASAIFLALLSGAGALQLGTNLTRASATEIEVEVYHVAFGKDRATRATVKVWADAVVDKIAAAVEKTINTWPLLTRQVTIKPNVTTKPSATRAGGSEEVFLEFHVANISPDSMNEELRAAIKAAIETGWGDYKGSMLQEPVYKALDSEKRHRARDERASGKGDPHLTNMQGERFDLYRSGVHALLQIPRKALPEETVLRVEADAVRKGAACADLYFQTVNITGSWAEETGGKLQFFADEGVADKSWRRFGEVDLKVVGGKTGTGITYLNVLVKHLSKVRFPVGGLIGNDDHTEAASPGPECLAAGTLDLYHKGAADVSIAEADA